MFKLEYGDASYGFGPVEVESVQIGGTSYRVNDTEREEADGIQMGRDFADPGDIVLDLHLPATQKDYESRRAFVRDEAAKFSGMWDAIEARTTDGALVAFTVGEFGVVEGRPRGVEWDFKNYAAGHLRGRARFVRARSGLLDSGWNQVEAQLTPPEEQSGWIHPLIFPLSGVVPAQRAVTFTVGGTGDAEPIIEVFGPVQAGAYVEVAGCFKFTVNRALAWDEVAKVDARSGISVLTVNKTPRMFLAPSSSRMSQMRMPPGDHQVIFRGSSVEGTARTRVSWRDVKAGL